jgi:GNAT superfamily N-acetyltransferase
VKDVPASRVSSFFAPERPGPLVHPHILTSGIGRCRVDRWPRPRTAVAELPGGNVAVRGEPRDVPGLTGLLDAAPEWLPVLRVMDPGTAVWPRLIAVLPDAVELPDPGPAVRRLTGADADALAGLHPSISWIGVTWGGAAGLAASGVAFGWFDDGRLLSVACAFYVGRRFEDVGVVTEPAHRGRGLSTACAAAVLRDVRARGRRPTWTTSPDNTGSRRVAEHLGFVLDREDVLYAVRTAIPPPD